MDTDHTVISMLANRHSDAPFRAAGLFAAAALKYFGPHRLRNRNLRYFSHSHPGAGEGIKKTDSLLKEPVPLLHPQNGACGDHRPECGSRTIHFENFS